MKGNPSPHRIVIAPETRDERARSRDVTAAKVEKYAEQRVRLAREAFDAALRDRENVGKSLWANSGVWWPELSPLEPSERTIVIKELRRVFGLNPDPRME